eukprot:742938_1
MQAHVRHVEKFTNFMSPVGLSISHYNNSHGRKRQTFSNLTNPPNVTGNVSSGSNSNSNSDTEHPTHKHSSHKQHPNVSHSKTVNTSVNNNNNMTVTENRWTRENLSLRHISNRQIFYDSDTVNNELMNNIIDKLLVYGYETSADIAKMQPWQLRVLKKEIPQIDLIFMTAYRIWGKQEYYDDTQNLTFRQYWDPAVWLQYNEIELIIKCFDISNRGYQCMICGVKHGLYELDVVRWHIWLEHKNSNQLNAIMQSSKKYNQTHNFTKPLRNLQLPPLDNGKSEPQVISLLDSTDDEMETKKKDTHKHTRRYTNKARQYNSKRNNNHNNNTRRRRSRRLANKHIQNLTTSPEIITPKTVQNPIIINGCNNIDDDNTNNNNNNNHRNDIMEIHGSLSPAFMPSAQINNNNNNNNNSNNKSVTILQTMNNMKQNDSTFSLDTHDTMNTHDIDMNDSYNWNNHNNNDMDDFNMIGFNDDFSTLGVMGALSRNSSDSFNQLNGAFVDPGKNFTFESQKKLNLNSNFAN